MPRPPASKLHDEHWLLDEIARRLSRTVDPTLLERTITVDPPRAERLDAHLRKLIDTWADGAQDRAWWHADAFPDLRSVFIEASVEDALDAFDATVATHGYPTPDGDG